MFIPKDIVGKGLLKLKAVVELSGVLSMIEQVLLVHEQFMFENFRCVKGGWVWGNTTSMKSSIQRSIRNSMKTGINQFAQL